MKDYLRLHKKLLYRFGFLVLLLALPVTIYTLQHQQNLRQRAETPPAGTGATITTIDTHTAPGSVTGTATSITIGTDNLPIISYITSATAGGSLKVAKCGNEACSSGNTITTLSPALYNTPDSFTSITIGSDGLPVIAFSNGSASASLTVVKCGDNTCSSGNTITALDSNTGQGSIAIGSDGLPVISYYKEDPVSDLRVIKCGNTSCSTGNTISIIDHGNGAGYHNAIAIGDDGLPVIGYFLKTGGNLKYAKCGNALCSSGNTVTVLDASINVGQYPSIKVASSGAAIVSYHDASYGYLRVATCNNVLCTGSNNGKTVDNQSVTGQYTSMALGMNNLPVISYYDVTNGDLKVAACTTEPCSVDNAKITTIDSSGDVGRFTSVAIGNDGLPVISYQDAANGDLKVAKCITPSCIPDTIPSTTPSISPDASTSATPSISLSPSISASPLPSPSTAPLGTPVDVTVLLHGIGTAGDNTNPKDASLSNKNPNHPSRKLTVSVLDEENKLVVESVGTVLYASASGDFSGTVDLQTLLDPGTYIFKVKSPQYLAKHAGTLSVASDSATLLPTVSLVAGDVNDDNSINILDYNILIGCYSDLAPSVACNDENKLVSDLTDDSKVNQDDYNLLLREFTVQNGD